MFSLCHWGSHLLSIQVTSNILPQGLKKKSPRNLVQRDKLTLCVFGWRHFTSLSLCLLVCKTRDNSNSHLRGLGRITLTLVVKHFGQCVAHGTYSVLAIVVIAIISIPIFQNIREAQTKRKCHLNHKDSFEVLNYHFLSLGCEISNQCFLICKERETLYFCEGWVKQPDYMFMHMFNNYSLHIFLRSCKCITESSLGCEKKRNSR